ncbi:MAG TPA: hypothetical protein VGA04_16560, partial [Streptosporangiaceae bacterium]
MTPGAPRLAQRGPQVGALAVRGGLVAAGAAERHGQGELAHEAGEHQQLSRRQFGEILIRQ